MRLMPQRRIGRTEVKGSALSELPPPVLETHFQAVDTTDREEIQEHFVSFIQDLHLFLNETSCLRDIQLIRRTRKPGITNLRAFRSFTPAPRHWYTHNAGGRNEAQFNIGLSPNYLRMGLGFELTKGRYGDPDVVWTAYDRFREALERQRQTFEQYAVEAPLTVELVVEGDDQPRYTQAQETLEWLMNPPLESDWIFVGRLLYRKRDREVLEDPVLLSEVMEVVFGNLMPYWEATQVNSG
jgi:hypothetical protein